MSKHTPGPWEAFTEDSFSGWWAIRQKTDDGFTTELGSCDGGFEEFDAKLIAASPTMYEFILNQAKDGCEKSKAMLSSLGLTD